VRRENITKEKNGKQQVEDNVTYRLDVEKQRE
jgi:hypothetical protein